MMSRREVVGLSVALLWCPLASVTAQSAKVVGATPSAKAAGATPSAKVAGATPSAKVDDAALPDTVAVAMAAPLRLTGDARSLFVVSVARPAAFAKVTAVRFRVVATGAMPLLGAQEGALRPDDDRVLFTISVPGLARAGVAAVATVQFMSVGKRVDVPVEFDVRARRGISLTPLTDLISLTQGGRTTMRIRIENNGNATDSVRVAAILPARWTTRVLEGDRLVLGARKFVERTVEIQSPAGGSTGAIPLTWMVRGMTAGDSAAASTERTRVESMLEVFGTSDARAAGPAVGLSIATVSAPGQSMATVLGVQVIGPITEHVQIEARWMQQASAGTPGLARVGGLSAPAFVALSAPLWRVDVGNAGMSLSEISGLNAQGRGVSARVQRDGWTVDAIGAQTSFVEQLTTPRGTLAAARATHTRNDLTLTATASHLRSGRVQSGYLDALALGVGRTFNTALSARAEIAARRFALGSGLGATAEVMRRDTRSEWRVRATRAPGGADAFALAKTDLTATGSQTLGATRLGTLAWYADDAGARGRFQRSRGISVLPQWRLGRQGSLGGELRVTDASGGDSLSRYGSATGAAAAFASGMLRQMNISTSATINRQLRDATLTTGLPFRSWETQLLWTTQVAFPTRIGVLDVYSGLQRAFGERVLFNGQHEWQLRMDNVSLPRTGHLLRGGASIGSVSALDGSSRYVTTRVNLSAILPFGAVVRLDRERNPLFSRMAGRSGWTTVLRVERSFGAPSFLSSARTGGVVFEDTNNNGRRDAGERGIPGVVVRSGGEVSITDGAGVYRIARRQVALVQLDERSLPFGLMVAPRQDLMGATDRAYTLRDIAVQPVSVVEIQLTLSDDPYAAGVPPSLQPVSVTAIDRDGRRFLARTEARGLRVFDALPPGEYRVEVDASEVTEPLTPRAALPTFVAQATRVPRRITVQLGPRRLRMFRGSVVTDTVRTPPKGRVP